MHQPSTMMKMALYVLGRTCVLLIAAGHGIMYVHCFKLSLFIANPFLQRWAKVYEDDDGL